MPKIYGDLEFQGTTRVVADNNGTALLPGITFSGDLNTGIYRHAADVLGFSTNGVLRFLINDEGALVISDTTAPVVTTNKLYSVSGNLFWNGGQLLANVVEDTTPQLGGNLDVLTNSIITSTTNGNITLTPNGAGVVVLSGLSYPAADGTSNQAIVTNGSGVLSFATLGGLNNVVEDTTPQLGGDLDVLTRSIITSTTNGNIAITPNGVGNIVLDGLSWPNADGTGNQVLSTNGSGALSWVDTIVAYTKTESDSMFANKALSNTFTASQKIEDSFPALIISDTGQSITAGGLWALNVGSTTFSIRKNTAAGGDFSTADAPLTINQDAKQLLLTLTDITYDGTSLLNTTIPAASETVSGIAEIATQTETDTGTDDLRFVTPLKLANYSGLGGSGSTAVQLTEYTAAAGQTVFGGPDDHGTTLAYTPGKLYVYMNGVLLHDTLDYVATTGTGIVLNTATVVNDLVQVTAFSTITGVGASASDFTYTATASQTNFTGNDDSGSPLSYNPGDVLVFLNGALLVSGIDYTETDSTNIDLVVGATVGNILQIFEWGSFLLSSNNQVLSQFRYVATAGQTTFDGTDANTNLLAYTAGSIKVYLNGALLADATDYTASNGTSVVLVSAATLSDVLQITAFGTFSVSNHYTKAESDSNFAPIGRSRKNLIINGDMRVWQRGASFPAIVDQTFMADRWEFHDNNTSVITASRLTSSDMGVPAMRLDVTTADTSIAATDFTTISYKVEGNDLRLAQFGSSNAKTLTLSFWTAHTKTGINTVSFRNSAANRSYVGEYTQVVSGVWEKQSITVPGDITGTWLVDNDIGIDIWFSVAIGTTFQTTAGSWVVGNFLASSNQVNNLDSTSNFFHLGAVQLEVGSEATDFEHRPFSEELALCQRYYEKSYNVNISPGTANVQGITAFTTETGLSAAVSFTYVPFIVKKRSIPTILVYGHNGTLNTITDGTTVERSPVGLLATTIGEYSFSQNYTLVSAADGRRRFHWTADAEL